MEPSPAWELGRANLKPLLLEQTRFSLLCTLLFHFVQADAKARERYGHHNDKSHSLA